MSFHTHSAEIISKIDSLLLFQRNEFDVLISMNDDPDLHTRVFYWGSVLAVSDKSAKPSASIDISRLAISHLDVTHLQATELFESLLEARDTVLTDGLAVDMLVPTVDLMGSIEKEMALKHEDHIVEFPAGFRQEIAIISMRTILGISRNT